MSDSPSKTKIEEIKLRRAAVHSRVVKSASDLKDSEAGPTDTAVPPPTTGTAAATSAIPRKATRTKPATAETTSEKNGSADVPDPGTSSTRTRTRSRASITEEAEREVAVPAPVPSVSEPSIETKATTGATVDAAGRKPPTATRSAARLLTTAEGTAKATTSMATTSRLATPKGQATAVSAFPSASSAPALPTRPAVGRISIGPNAKTTAASAKIASMASPLPPSPTEEPALSSRSDSSESDVRPAAVATPHAAQIGALEQRLAKANEAHLADLQKFHDIQEAAAQELADAKAKHEKLLQLNATIQAQNSMLSVSAAQKSSSHLVDSLTRANESLVLQLQQADKSIAELTEAKSQAEELAMSSNAKLAKMTEEFSLLQGTLEQLELREKVVAASEDKSKQEMTARIVELETDVASSQQGLDAIQSNMHAATTSHVIIVEELKQQVARLQTELESCTLDRESLQIDKETLQLENEENQAQLQQLSCLRSEVSRLNLELAAACEERDSLHKAAVPLLNTPSKPANPELKTPEISRMVSPHTGMDLLREHNSKLRTALVTLKEKLDETIVERDAAATSSAILRQENIKLSGEVAEMKAMVDAIAAERIELNEQVAELRALSEGSGAGSVAQIAEALAITNSDLCARVDAQAQQLADYEEMRLLDEQLEVQHAEYEAQLVADIVGLETTVSMLQNHLAMAKQQLADQLQLRDVSKAGSLDPAASAAPPWHNDLLSNLMRSTAHAKVIATQQLVFPGTRSKVRASAEHPKAVSRNPRSSLLRLLFPPSVEKADAVVLLDSCENLIQVGLSARICMSTWENINGLLATKEQLTLGLQPEEICEVLGNFATMAENSSAIAMQDSMVQATLAVFAANAVTSVIEFLVAASEFSLKANIIAHKLAEQRLSINGALTALCAALDSKDTFDSAKIIVALRAIVTVQNIRVLSEPASARCSSERCLLHRKLPTEIPSLTLATDIPCSALTHCNMMAGSLLLTSVQSASRAEFLQTVARWDASQFNGSTSLRQAAASITQSYQLSSCAVRCVTAILSSFASVFFDCVTNEAATARATYAAIADVVHDFLSVRTGPMFSLMACWTHLSGLHRAVASVSALLSSSISKSLSLDISSCALLTLASVAELKVDGDADEFCSIMQQVELALLSTVLQLFEAHDKMLEALSTIKESLADAFAGKERAISMVLAEVADLVPSDDHITAATCLLQKADAVVRRLTFMSRLSVDSLVLPALQATILERMDVIDVAGLPPAVSAPLWTAVSKFHKQIAKALEDSTSTDSLRAKLLDLSGKLALRERELTESRTQAGAMQQRISQLQSASISSTSPQVLSPRGAAAGMPDTLEQQSRAVSVAALTAALRGSRKRLAESAGTKFSQQMRMLPELHELRHTHTQQSESQASHCRELSETLQATRTLVALRRVPRLDSSTAWKDQVVQQTLLAAAARSHISSAVCVSVQDA